MQSYILFSQKKITSNSQGYRIVSNKMISSSEIDSTDKYTFLEQNEISLMPEYTIHISEPAGPASLSFIYFPVSGDMNVLLNNEKVLIEQGQIGIVSTPHRFDKSTDSPTGCHVLEFVFNTHSVDQPAFSKYDLELIENEFFSVPIEPEHLYFSLGTFSGKQEYQIPYTKKNILCTALAGACDVEGRLIEQGESIVFMNIDKNLEFDVLGSALLLTVISFG